ncbi:MAG: sigma-70 family RNA polymerase sigma factor [Candidatus Riflebacteria bacterium]|nr:sigma-70 family RNA polymerase sigma factor [Candidatus Riflebacteria bacterium]
MSTDSINEDKNLILKILDGEGSLYSVIVTKYERLVYSYLLPQLRTLQEVEDLSQETFLKAYRHLGSFDVEKKFSSWLMKIAKNLLIDYNRKKSLLPNTNNTTENYEDSSEKFKNSETFSPYQRIELKEEFKSTFKDILLLPEEIRIPFLLRVIQELSYEEIAEILDIPLQTVKNRIFKARQALKEKRKSNHEM